MHPQNLDSSEISLTDVSHYFDSDPTKLVSGLRGDGKMPSSYIAGAPPGLLLTGFLHLPVSAQPSMLHVPLAT